MSGYDNNNYSEVFDGDDLDTQSGGGLRKQLEQALGEIRSLRNELNQGKRQETVSGLFKSRGFDPAASALVPADADPQKWLEQNAQFLRSVEGAPADQAKEAVPDEQAKPDPQLEAERQQLQGLEEAGETGIPSLATADQLTKLKSFDNEADLMAFIQSGGVG